MTHQLLPHPFYKVQVQFPAYIHILHNHKIKIQIAFLSPLKAQNRGGKKSGKGKSKTQQQPQPPPSLPEEEEHYEETNNYYDNENYRGNNRGHKPYRGQQSGGRKPYRGSQQRGGGQQTTIGANTKATMDNLTPPAEAITIIIIMVIIKVEVDVAVVVIITEVAATDKAITDLLMHLHL